MINWQCFGSNGQEKSDYSRGVLERFTRRASKDWTPNGMGNAHVKTIANLRKINFTYNSHYVNYFEGAYSINENCNVVDGPFNEPTTTEKMVINHYFTKSKEEYLIKHNRGDVSTLRKDVYLEEDFKNFDRNEEFDDGILKYREERAKVYQPPDNSHADERLFNALVANLSPTLLPNTPPEFYAGKMETFLTCRAVAAYLTKKLTDAAPAKLFEEASLVAILRTLASGGINFADARLLISELPNLLTLPYPVINELRGACLNIIPQLMNVMRLSNSWIYYVELDYIQRLLQLLK